MKPLGALPPNDHCQDDNGRIKSRCARFHLLNSCHQATTQPQIAGDMVRQFLGVAANAVDEVRLATTQEP